MFADAILRGFGIYTGQYEKMGEQIGAVAFSQEFELEADYIGLYIMARAGYSTDHAANFWRKMAARSPWKRLIGTHPPAAAIYTFTQNTSRD